MFRRIRQRHAPKGMGPHARRVTVESLEERRLLAGDLAADNSPVLVFVDSAVEGYQDLIQDLVGTSDPGTSAATEDSDSSSLPDPVEVVILDGDRDGVVQISETLSQYTEVSTVHVLSHGSKGSLQLGNATLDNGSLDAYASQLSDWGESLAHGADILLYGCNVAEGTWGIDFVNDLAGVIDVDVAASNNLTGAATLGGDWTLETATGVIESRVLVAEEYQGVLFDVCIDDNRCTHEEMTGYAGDVFFASYPSSELNIEHAKAGAGHEDEVDHIYGWHTSPVPGAVTFTHFWDADIGPYAPSYVDGPASLFGPFANSWQKAEQYWSLALGEYANGNTDMAYHFLGHIAHQIGDNTIPTHVHVSAHDPFSGDDSMEDWMSQGNDNEPPGSDLLPGEAEALSAAGPLEIPLIPGRTETDVGKLYWLMYTTNQIADFFPSDRASGDTFDPEGWVQDELNMMDATITSPRTPADLEDNDCNNPVLCVGIGDDDNNADGDLGVIREHSYLRGIRAIASLFELFEQTVSSEPIVVVTIERVEELVGCSIINEDCDFYSRVTIDGAVGINEGDECFDCISQFGSNFFPNWAWGRVVGTSGSIPLKIEILDDDNAFDDGLVKIKHEPGTALDLNLDLAKCLTGEGGAITGDGIPGGTGRVWPIADPPMLRKTTKTWTTRESRASRFR